MWLASVLLTLAAGICVGAVRAQNAAEGPDAQRMIQQGLDAVQVRDEQSANLAFAQVSQAGGSAGFRRDRARRGEKFLEETDAYSAGYAAYLADEPKAPDAAEIKAKIDALDAATRDQVARLLTVLQEAIVQSPWSDARNYEMRDMVGRWAGLGDFAAAKKVIEPHRRPEYKMRCADQLGQRLLPIDPPASRPWRHERRAG